MSLFWLKKERTRKKSLLIYGLFLIISFISFGIITDTEEKDIEIVKKPVSGEDNASEVKEEELSKIELKKNFQKKKNVHQI